LSNKYVVALIMFEGYYVININDWLINLSDPSDKRDSSPKNENVIIY